MKVGDYVRTPLGITKYLGNYKMFDGSISKNLHEFDKLDESLWSGDLYDIVFGCDLEDIVLKSSPNIIDLIEVGDYVNGIEVHCVYDDDSEANDYNLKHKKCIGTNIYDTDFQESLIYEEAIKSIVTKEQFESMQYNLESEVN